MDKSVQFSIGGSSAGQVSQLGRMSNRHGMIAGATGTGKTVTLQVLAENFSRLGVPVFAADVKGDLSGLAATGKPHPKIDERLAKIGITDYQQRGYPVVFWDVYGEHGHRVRTTVSEMGPLLLASLLELNDTQEGVLYAAFRIADDQGLLMLDLKDLRSMLNWMGDHAGELRSEYGNLSTASLGAIQRRLLVLEEQGGDRFFGEPALELRDLMQRDFSGNGVISLFDATKLLQQAPRVYTAFLLWLLAELYEQLPERGDTDRPELVFFFDEAHLLFEQASKALRDRIEQVVRLIRSKGVGVYFISQNPTDVPEDILGQLGMKVQHALRAFTPKDRKAVSAVAANFRPNPAVDVESELTELGTGEALVSTLGEKGEPLPVQRVLIAPPESRIGPLSDEERRERIARSPLQGRYDQSIDRESAYEVLKQRAEQQVREAERDRPPAREKTPARSSAAGRSRQSVSEAFIKSAARSVGSQLGRQIMRGLLGSIFGGRR
ncbi:MAG: ATP-binding protein [Gammaproteobacteria bacterium SG8_47]|nr:MAG: ATP-binding protein [Gammaproteobacteria bacterium SG8_47]